MINIDSARRLAAIKSSDQILDYRKDLLISAPMLSFRLFDGLPGKITTEVFSETQNRALLASMKRSSDQPRVPAKPQAKKADWGKKKANMSKYTKGASTPARGSKRKDSFTPRDAKKTRFSDNRPRKQYK